ncbi:uncharacterized protein N7482_007544 [Penicillium canariense]|uniref:DUF7730 domain-containing protein n=1 Tax=Penicillium canariense TaxID=189055 RepID=A0A9W9I1W9_9EURO|nr:uncharacterized protein N7482_007544 [Penicillium canariense]KAJ5160540.1 hypothetical protein N7482_007544 [Penicillium canariense]
MRHFDAWVVRDPYSIWHYYATGQRWKDTQQPLPVPLPLHPKQPPDLLLPPHPPPPEIRHMIWGFVFGADTLHLVTVKDKVRHVRCNSASPSLTQHRHCCPTTPARWRVSDSRVQGHSDGLLYPHTHAQLPSSLSDGNVALLRTCRAIHAEAATTLYAQSTFDVDDLYTFIAFAQSVPRAALSSIRRLTVQWMPVWTPLTGQDHKGSIYAHTHSDVLWLQFWAAVASLPALRALKLSIDLGRFTGTVTGGGAVLVAGQRIPLVLKEPWLLPLLNVRGLEEFELAVTARCDVAARGVIEGDLCRDAGVLRDQLRAVMCSRRGVPLGALKELGLDVDGVWLRALEELGEESPVRRAGPRLAIMA